MCFNIRRECTPTKTAQTKNKKGDQNGVNLQWLLFWPRVSSLAVQGLALVNRGFCCEKCLLAQGMFYSMGISTYRNTQKYSRPRCMLRVKGLVNCFYLGWSGSTLQFRQNMIKVGSNSWLLTCSSNATLSLPSYTGSALKKELNFCNGYLSLLYFCLEPSLKFE